MSLATRIEGLLIRVAQEFKDVRAKAGNLANLSTTDQATAMPDASYCWTALARGSTRSAKQRAPIVHVGPQRKSAQYVDISCATQAGDWVDSPEVNLVVFR